MKASITARALAAALAGVAPGVASTCVHAAIKDYAFQLVDKSVTVGPDTIISVRLVDTRTGKTVPDAVIIAMRLDMAPDGMAEMASKIAPIPGSAPGIYRFKAKVSSTVLTLVVIPALYALIKGYGLPRAQEVPVSSEEAPAPEERWAAE